MVFGRRFFYFPQQLYAHAQESLNVFNVLNVLWAHHPRDDTEVRICRVGNLKASIHPQRMPTLAIIPSVWTEIDDQKLWCASVELNCVVSDERERINEVVVSFNTKADNLAY